MKRNLTALLLCLLLLPAVSEAKKKEQDVRAYWCELAYKIAHPVLDHLSRKTPERSRVLLLFERRGLFVPREYRVGTPYFQERFFTPVPDRADAVLETLRHEGIDYILVGATEQNPEHLERYDRENLKLSLHLRSLLRSGALRLVTVPGGGDYTLLAVEPPPERQTSEK